MLLINLVSLAEKYYNLKKCQKSELFSEIGKSFILLMLMVVTILIGFKGYNDRSDYCKNDLLERMALSRVKDALHAYADDNEGKYPPADNWYDELFHGEEKPYFSDEEFNIVLNPHALELGNNLPDDMVIAFISYNGDLGQVGVYDDRHFDVGPILRYKINAGEYSSSYNTIRAADAKYLKWSSGEPEMPVQKTNEIYSILGVFVFLLLIFAFKYRKYILNNLIMMVSIAFLSVISGDQFGDWANAIYKGFSGKTIFYTYGISTKLAVIFSCIFVLCMADYRAKCKYEYCVGWVTFYGTLVGILCSCVLHLLLMFIYNEYTIYPLLTGVPFGAWAGMILGWWTGSWLDKKHKKQLAESEVGNE